MIENPEEKVNALTKLADLVGKKPLVLWAIFTTFTTGYLFVRNDKLQDKLFTTQGEGYERLVKEVKGINDRVNKTEVQVEKFGQSKEKLDTLINKATQKLDNIK